MAGIIRPDRWKLHEPDPGPVDPYQQHFERQLRYVECLADDLDKKLAYTQGGSVLPSFEGVDPIHGRKMFVLQAVDCARHSTPNTAAPAWAIEQGIAPAKTTFARPVLVCGHAAHAPVEDLLKTGIWRTPGRFYLCKDCWGRLERRRLELVKVLVLGCHSCLMEKIQAIQNRDAAKFTDLTAPA